MTEYGRIAVIGGGPAGMMAAGTAAVCGASVTLFDHAGRLGKKLAITGTGRCNVTNACALAEFLDNVPRNPRFLFAALHAFSPDDTVEFFTSRGVPLKMERGRRVFPESDRAADIVRAMRDYAAAAEIRFENVHSIEKKDGSFCVTTDTARMFDAVILSTGGRSYPLTGSDGSGYRLARKLGHTVTPLSPSLVPLDSSSDICEKLQGVSLRNIRLRVFRNDGKCLYEDFGEMMFTHFGVTGPTVLSASAHLREEDIASLRLSVDLKPALDEATLDRRLLSDFTERANKDFLHAMDALLPQKMTAPFIERTGIDPHRKTNTVTKEERRRILSLLKDFSVPLSGFRPIEEAIVTAGGVDVKEVSPKDMQSKRIPGLFFAGEILDVDAYTGGYNLQIAFSTGHLAGKSAAEYVTKGNSTT